MASNRFKRVALDGPSDYDKNFESPKYLNITILDGIFGSDWNSSNGIVGIST